MKTTKGLLFVAVISLLLIACSGEAQKTVETTNSSFKVELLFIKDGCSVYRFYDLGHYVYFTDCTGNTQSTYTTSDMVGKTTTTTTHYIQNETVK